jgi:hypothetical protein
MHAGQGTAEETRMPVLRLDNWWGEYRARDEKTDTGVWIEHLFNRRRGLFEYYRARIGHTGYGWTTVGDEYQTLYAAQAAAEAALNWRGG